MADGRVGAVSDVQYAGQHPGAAETQEVRYIGFPDISVHVSSSVVEGDDFAVTNS